MASLVADSSSHCLQFFPSWIEKEFQLDPFSLASCVRRSAFFIPVSVYVLEQLHAVIHRPYLPLVRQILSIAPLPWPFFDCLFPPSNQPVHTRLEPPTILTFVRFRQPNSLSSICLFHSFYTSFFHLLSGFSHLSSRKCLSRCLHPFQSSSADFFCRAHKTVTCMFSTIFGDHSISS